MGKLLILVLGLALGLLLARYLRGRRTGRDLAAPPPRPMMRVGDERIDDEEIRALIRQDRKIDAIKLVRERTGFSLAEAKDAVEALEQNNALKFLSPTGVQATPKGRHMSVVEIAIEVIGWLAAILILASYVLLSLGKIEPRSYLYQWMNVIGASGFVLNSGYNGALPSAGLNIVWALMGVFTLWTVWRARQLSGES